MELQQIEYFRVIARTQNISKAAEQLYIAQPSLSQTLKRLEDEIGTPLFDRRGKHIVLNEAGKIFQKYADEIFRALENSQLEINEYKGNASAEVNISVESASLLLPEIIARIQRGYPDIKLRIFQSNIKTDVETDLRIYSDFCPCTSSGVILMHEPLGAVLPKGHTLAVKETITAEELQSCEIISLAPHCNLYNIIDHFFQISKLSAEKNIYVDSPAIMRELLKANLGIAIIPQYTWHEFYNGLLEFRAISEPVMSRYIILAQSNGRYPTSHVNVCQEIIIDFFKEYNRKFL